MNTLEREARIDLAAALRWAARLGLSEGICNHFSLAVPGAEDHFLINPQGLHWAEITPADLVVVDAHGRKVEGRYGVEPTAFFIHGAIHRGARRPHCVMHTHMPYATALTVVHGGRLEWASQNALKFYGRVAYDDGYNGLALDEAEGELGWEPIATGEPAGLVNRERLGVGLLGRSQIARATPGRADGNQRGGEVDVDGGSQRSQDRDGSLGVARR